MGEIAHVRIVRAALRCGYAVYSVAPPGRHHHCFAMISEDGASRKAMDAEQGFITSTGDFVDRVTANTIARAAGQIIEDRKTGNPHVLYSEDLW